VTESRLILIAGVAGAVAGAISMGAGAYLSSKSEQEVTEVEVSDRPRPLALYEMIHPPGTPRAGEVYRIVVSQARLRSLPRDLSEDEVLAIIALTREQVIRGPERKPTLAELLEEGARIVASVEPVDSQTRLYPLGTARALAYLLRCVQGQPSPFSSSR
jgi:hypothetical protein